MRKTPIQVMYIHGGMTFKNRKDYLNFLKKRSISIDRKIKWHDSFLDKSLGKNFKVIRPQMPLKDYAQYEDRRIHFERYISLLRNNIILIGGSLG